MAVNIKLTLRYHCNAAIDTGVAANKECERMVFNDHYLQLAIIMIFINVNITFTAL